MPISAPMPSDQMMTGLKDLGNALRLKRKALKISATAVAEASGISRVTLHRIEKGEPSVTMGSWFSVMGSLGLCLQVSCDGDISRSQHPPVGWIPVQIDLADYPQLRSLCWHISGLDTLSPIEALEIYERNARHLDLDEMPEQERALWEGLKHVFLRSAQDV